MSGLETVVRWRWRRIRQDRICTKGRTAEDVDRRNRKKWAATKLQHKHKQHSPHGVVNGIRIWRVVGVAVRRWNFDCGADYTGIAIVGIAAATVVGPVPPALPLPPTIPETLCGYPVDIDSPNPKTGANPVRDIPLDPGHPAPAAAANIKFPPPVPNVPSPPPLRAKHKPSHDFWRYLDREWQLELDSDLMFGSDSEPAATGWLYLEYTTTSAKIQRYSRLCLLALLIPSLCTSNRLVILHTRRFPPHCDRSTFEQLIHVRAQFNLLRSYCSERGAVLGKAEKFDLGLFLS
ncbi:hypothetical protein BU17DRAFT_70112 [Hysterangium stoloniferum]|nr:hypothetical protein BU17DRAFT_70112 [Hysterangium stoloniferum]